MIEAVKTVLHNGYSILQPLESIVNSSIIIAVNAAAGKWCICKIGAVKNTFYYAQLFVFV